MHRFCSSLKFSSTKSLQTRFVAPHKPSIDTFLVMKVIISNDKFIAIYTMKLKNLGHDLVFLIFTDKKSSHQQEPGLREKITENMISEYSTDRVFSPILMKQTLPLRLLK